MSAPFDPLAQQEREAFEGMRVTAYCAFLHDGFCDDGHFVVDGWTSGQIAAHGEAAIAEGRALWQADGERHG